MSLLDELNDVIRKDSKTYGGVLDDDFTTNTGFETLDYLNGQIITQDNGEKQIYTGLSSSRIVMIIGKSGSGKSTLAMQIAGNIIQRYENGLLYIYDFEQNNTRERFRQVTGVSEDYYDHHVTILRDGINTEKVYQLLCQIKKFKLDHRNELLVDNENGIKDEEGNIKKVLPPTVVIIDSLAMMMPEDNIETEEIQGSMAATSIAKVNSQFFKKAVQVCNTANIIILMVNHITQQIAIGVTPPSAVLNYLKQDEAISGGKAALYVTDTLLKITTGSKLEPEKGAYGIKGFEAKIEICKSRHAPAGRSVNMIYDQTNGFRNDLSLIDYIKACGGLGGNGMAYYIQGHPEYKFRMSTFAEKYKDDSNFRKLVEDTAKSYLIQSIHESDRIQQIEETPITEQPTETSAPIESTISGDSNVQ